jgi:hypothetical protein
MPGTWFAIQSLTPDPWKENEILSGPKGGSPDTGMSRRLERIEFEKLRGNGTRFVLNK